MARNSILFDPEPTVMPTGAPGDYQRIGGVTDEAFGGAVARGLGQFGQGIERAAETGLDIMTARQKLDNEVHASELNTWLAKRITDRFEDFGKLEGRAAQDALPGFKQGIDDDYKEHLGQANSPAMQAQLAKNGRYLTDAYYRYATNHANRQWRTWADKTATDRAAEYGNQAQNARMNGDYAGMEISLNTSDDEVRKLYEQRGWDGAEIRAEVAKNRGRNLKNVIESMIDEDPAAAVGMFKKYGDQMDAASQAAVKGKLRAANSQIVGRGIGDEETGHKLPKAEDVGGLPGSFVAAIKQSEGYSPVAKSDYKQFSSGYGTKAEFEGEKIDRPEAERRFAREIDNAAKFVDGVNPKLDAGTRAALTSLTYNAGGDWAASGLGQKIRENDIAGARDLFLQYNRAGGQPNKGLIDRRYREASWFGLPEAPAGGMPLVDKAQAYERILARTDGQPLVQNAAIARMNQIYSVYHAQEVQQHAAFDQKYKDSLAESAATGKTSTPLTESEFVNRFKDVNKGTEAYKQYQKDLQFGADLMSSGTMTPQEQAELLARQEPQPGEGFAAQSDRYRAAAKAIDHVNQEKVKDPAGFALKRLPAVQAAYQGFINAQNDAQLPAAGKQAAARQFAQTMLNEQERVGLAEGQQRLMPKSYIDSLNAKLQRPVTAGGTSGVADMLTSEAQMWGDQYWPMVQRELAKEARPAVRVISSGVDPMAARLLVDLEPLSPAAILKDESTEKMSGVQTAVRDAVRPFSKTLAGQDGGATVLHDFEGQITKLTAYYVATGEMKPTEAAEKAFKQVLGFKYEFRDNMRIPKDVPQGVDAIVRGAEIAKTKLADHNIAIPPDTVGGLSEDYRRTAARSTLARDAVWVTAPGDTGLGLVWKDGVVRKKDGSPLMLTWKELADMAGNSSAPGPARRAGDAAAGWLGLLPGGGAVGGRTGARP